MIFEMRTRVMTYSLVVVSLCIVDELPLRQLRIWNIALGSDWKMSSSVSEDALNLNFLREQLIRQEETIIFNLIERAQWKQNTVVYQPGLLLLILS